jgi:oligogalacturonide lyase
MRFREILLRSLSGITMAMLSAACLHAQGKTSDETPPHTWIDPDTGHRIIRLTNDPGSSSLYFNINAYTPDGRQMVYSTPDKGIGILDLTTLAQRQLVAGPVGGGPGALLVGRRNPRVYFFRGSRTDPKVAALWVVDITTGRQHKVADLPPRAGIFSINADETLGVGSFIVGDGEDYNGRQAGQVAQASGNEEPANKAEKMARRLAAHLPMVIFTLDLHSGRIKTVFKSTDWIDHLQFSPTDPTLLMYAHQGAWQQVDKLWTIRTDGSHQQHIDPRIMKMEGSGHQWWDTSGHVIWYDLHIPAGLDSFVAGYNVTNGERTWYHYQPQEASIHFNRSADGTLFAGDGSDAPGAKWLYLFRPELIPDDHTLGKDLIQPGVLRAERLVNMSRHNYHLEPNVNFTPDGKYVIFRSNMFGPTYAFAVEVKRAEPVK